MKKLFLFSFMVLAGMQANTQSLPMNSSLVKNSVMVPSSEGKFNVYNGSYSSESNPLMQFYPGYTESNLNTGAGSHRSPDVETFHVVFHFDYAYEWFFCIGKDTAYADYYNMTPINETTLEGDLDEGYYYMIASFVFFNPTNSLSTAKHVLQEGFHVYKDMDTTILSTSADNLLSWEMLDENGAEIPLVNKPGNNLAFYYTFPDTMLIPNLCYFYWMPVETVHFSDLPSGMQIRMSRTAVEDKSITDDGHYHEYVINYPFITSLQQDTVLTNDPLEYGSFPHVMHNSPSYIEGYYGFGFGAMQNPMLSDPYALIYTVANFDYPVDQSDTCVLFESGWTDPTDLLFFYTSLYAYERAPNTIEDSWYNMSSAIRYLSAEGDLIQSEGYDYPPSVFDYRIPDGTTVDLGNNAPPAMTFCFNVMNSTQLSMYVSFNGQVNEFRQMDNVTGSYDIWLGDQYIGSGPIELGEISTLVDYPAIYTITVEDSNYIILGKTGKRHIAMTTDLLAQDPNPPTLTFFRLLQGDRISQKLIPGNESSLWLRAGDKPPGSSGYEPPASVRAYCKNSSDTTWMELSLIPVTSLFDPQRGMPYTANLEPVLTQYPDSTWVDVRLELTDQAGNSAKNTISPAFLISNQGVGNGTEIPLSALSYYPNPAYDLVTVTGTPGPVEVTIYSMVGDRVLHTLTDRIISVSALTRGLYLISLKDLTTGEIRTGKLTIAR